MRTNYAGKVKLHCKYSLQDWYTRCIDKNRAKCNGMHEVCHIRDCLYIKCLI